MDLKLERIVGRLIHCFAIYLFAIEVLSLLQLWMDGFSLTLYGILSTALGLGIIIFLWQKSPLIANKLIPLGDGKTVRVSLSRGELLNLSIAVVGFCLAAAGLLRALRGVLHPFFYGVKIGLLEFLIGLAATLSAKGFSKIMIHLRN